MTVISVEQLGKLLDYLDTSIKKLDADAIDSKFQITTKRRDFYKNQYDARLQNLLRARNSSIHHLESGMKNMVIQRRDALLDRLERIKT